MQKKCLLLLIVSMGLLSVVTGQQHKAPDFSKLPGHPRILLLKDEEKIIRTAISQNQIWAAMDQAIFKECDKIIALPPVERIQIGRRLLDKSRECLRRVFYLSYASRMTGDDKYFVRAEKELLAVSKFSDWNPSHFLDVAEMTMAVAIGYDWLFDKLSLESKKIIQEAIVKKGLELSFDNRYNHYLKATHNWNQVCNAGMTYGALAVAEDYPELSEKILSTAINTIHLPMDEYKPDGAYPEGYGYWGYGTSFNVMFLSAVEKALSSDFGLTQVPGFLSTAKFLRSMTGPTGLCFNWGDSGMRGHLSPAMFWFAQKSNDPSLLWVEKDYLKTSDFSGFTNDRLLPAIMIWGKGISFDKIEAPSQNVWTGQGANPVSIMRTSWSDPNAIYLGFKAGSPSVNHGHMDVGSFVMESDGVRWASDFGMQEYESLESKGMHIFGRTQDAQRWTILRMNNYVHNTLTVDGQLQLVKGYAKIDKHSDAHDFSYAVSDLSTVYENQLASVKRGVGIVKGEYVVIHDELKATDKPATIKWVMMTSANVEITGKNTATLTKEGKKLFLRVDSPANTTISTWSTQPTTNYDAPNPGTILVGFEVNLKGSEENQFTVLLIPEKAAKKAKAKIKPLKNW
ncbi:heparinase II/III domain-containing protein [Chryseosolibacter indicus]|uniref:Heparinase II/III family protein n=1 Tax=Chryseosolibacter indicus TaxID=2782351 RepID=A0ABS5VQT6_9BACT|nr:heparinase II/III family protein [Chryseosolibacter indicus]MBT1703773.1 heparinase II/III family protein [Chryseosolibacter indicus]